MVAVLTVLSPARVVAQTSEPGGFGPAAAQAQTRFEATLLEGIDADSIRRWARALGARPHVAGTPEQAVTRDSVLAWMSRAGLEVRADSFVAYLPQPIHVSLERTHPDPRPIPLDEPEIPEAGPPARDPFRAFNAYTGSGLAEGEVVFANYGLPRDYAVLDSLAVEVTGRIVLARYGRSFRGIKAREAEARGAVGLILYSDPADDGYRAGDVYPGGPMRPGFGVQRGSILNASGDPSTPGWPSLPDARRIAEAEMEGIARIPVVPISHQGASELLEGLGGPGAPEDWQGALPFHYHIGPGPVRARVRTVTERGREALHPIFNTVGILHGSELPDEWVILGAHRDAWGPGARDNVSGTATVLAAARAFALAAHHGLRPRRTILFATWDAEEWGLVGSTEWVEANAEEVSAFTVAYLNQDAPAGGRAFYASATPELKTAVRQAAAAVESPEGGGSVLDRWAQRSSGGLGSGWPAVGDLGGGSDHVPFVQTLGLPGAGFGFGGRGGVYHSAYDAADWMERFGDPGYRHHAAAASILSVLAARLANAELLPYDFPEVAADLERRLGEVSADLGRWSETAEREALGEAVESLRGEIFRFGEEAGLYDAAAAAALRAGAPAARLAEVNRLVRQAATAFTTDRALPGLPGLRRLLYATDPDNGYATLALPGLHLALRQENADELRRRIEELQACVNAAGRYLAEARRTLEGPSGETG
ncbi:MAG: M28 family peptidase [Gemmatimonadota bacterium]|nr:MAG: M28 family peptidase [Gemmatimonadota bacterium]